MEHPKAAKTRLIAGRKRAKRLKHEARCPVELESPTQRTEEPESHPRKGGHWIGNPELKAPREKRKRPGETGRPQDFRTRTLRMANQPRKVETDTVHPASGKHHGKGEQPASQPSEENPARHRAGERQHPPGRRSRPNPRRGRTATGRGEEGPSPTSPSVRVPQTQDPPEARTGKCGTYIATEQNGLPKEGTKPPRGKAGPLVRAQL